MYLKTLTLKGFKSFAHTTTIELEHGVTAVVGPNGSGKSNVVDAIAWVLGAQGARTVRSGKMDDVIFAGTSKLAALGRAEVSLTIDNADRKIPLDLNEVTISRTLFRSGESEYGINGAQCRLLDIQEMLSDAGVGRQQHVIVSQGNLARILDAQPEDRRSVIEEAAGILKYRKRKEKAERRLEASEGNLQRLQDLVREVRRQMRPLERQATAARRHEELAGELGALRLYQAGRELVTQETRLQQARVNAERDSIRAPQLVAELDMLDISIEEVEAELTAQGGDGLSDRLGRAEGLRQRARGLTAVLTERRRSIDRARDAAVDGDLVASLEAESAQLVDELNTVEYEAAALLPLLEELQLAEGELAAERTELESAGDTSASSMSTPATTAAEAKAELGPLHAAVRQSEIDLARLQERIDQVEDRLRVATNEHGVRSDEFGSSSDSEAELVAAFDNATAALAKRQTAVEALDERLSTATEAHRTAQARAEALAFALEQARTRAGTEQLQGIDGVLGSLLELVEVDDNWQAAFEAAVGDALAAVVVDGTDAARRALEHLRDTGSAGAVLALLPDDKLPVFVAIPGTEPIRRHVRSSHEGVSRLLDRLLARAVRANDGWQEAAAIAVSDLGLVVVSEDGSRFAGPSWTTGVAGAGVTLAAVDEANDSAREAELVVNDLAPQLAHAQTELSTAVELEASTRSALSDNDAVLAAAKQALQRLDSEIARMDSDRTAALAERDELQQRVVRDRQRVSDIELRLPELEAEEAKLGQQAEALEAFRKRVDERARATETLRRDVEVRAAGIEERRTLLTARRTEVEGRLARVSGERARAEELRMKLDDEADTVERLAGVVSAQSVGIDAEIAVLSELRRVHQEATAGIAARLDVARKRRHECSRELEEVREGLRRSEIDEAESRVRLEAAIETLQRELHVEPDEARNAPRPDLPEGVDPATRLAALDDELRRLGPVNPLALAELGELEERHTFLEAQLEDVRTTRRELAQVIRAVDEQIVTVFTEAFDDVQKNFRHLFTTLFPGGVGDIRLTDSANPLDAGVELEARPSGKNVRRLSLLSGGERSLTALAFLFAVFRSRPSPFYLLDEVEAALDDVNLKRFIDLLEEFRDEAQLIVVTHQKRTMESADLLYGVTMQPGGSTKVVSEKVQRRGGRAESSLTTDLRDPAPVPTPV